MFCTILVSTWLPFTSTMMWLSSLIKSTSISKTKKWKFMWRISWWLLVSSTILGWISWDIWKEVLTIINYMIISMIVWIDVVLGYLWLIWISFYNLSVNCLILLLILSLINSNYNLIVLNSILIRSISIYAILFSNL